jgi:hypothetical protein
MTSVRTWGRILVLTGLMVILASCSRPAASSRVQAGQPAPEIEGTDLDGQPLKLSDYRGKVVLLSFWGKW